MLAFSIPVLPLRRWEPSYGHDAKLPYSVLSMTRKTAHFLFLKFGGEMSDKRLVLVTVYTDRGNVYRLAYGKVLPDGKVIVRKSIINDALEKLGGVERGANVWGWL
jgi:hypothetical protein